MIPALIFPLLLTSPAGIHVNVMGEGKLRFLVGRKVVTSADATLSPNAAGLLADDKGHAITPYIRAANGEIKIAMNGIVTVGGAKAGQLVLERPSADGTDFAFPGQDGMGILQINSVGSQAPVIKSSSTIPARTTPASGTPKTTTTVGSTTTISIHPLSEIVGERVILGDIADIDGEPTIVAKLKTLDLGVVPPLGQRRTFNSWSLKAAFRTQGVVDNGIVINFPPDVMLSRKGQDIDGDTLIAQAREQAAASIKGDLALSAGPAPITVPLGEIAYSGEVSRMANYLMVTVKVTVDGKPAGQRIVKFNAPTGGVKIGDAVHISLSRNGARIETDGKAKTAGYIGDTIQVSTLDGAVLSATVTANGAVEVKL